MRINRLLQIIIHLMTSKNVTVRLLSEHFDVSRKTIYKDLEVLITSGIPVIYGENASGNVEILEGFDLFKALKATSGDIGKNEESKVYNEYEDNKEILKNISTVWEGFTKNLNTDFKYVREEILHSWIRCRRSDVSTHKVDHDNLLPPEDIDKYEIENALGKENTNVMLFSKLIKEMKWHGCICDNDAKLKYLINPLPDYHLIYPQVGYEIDASESVIGTNGVSLALVENKSVMVSGPEHYNKSYHQVSCAASPIYDGEERIGVLNMYFVHTSVHPEVKSIIGSLARIYETLIINSQSVKVKDHSKPENADQSFKKQVVEIPTLVGESLHMKRIMSTARAMADIDTPVSIIGEEGVGKKTIAKYIHAISNRKYGPCVAFDCKKMKTDRHKEYIFGSELSGSKNLGVVEKAIGGSLIIENLNYLPLDIQGQLARLLASGQAKRKGSKKWREYDVRVFLIVKPTEIHNLDPDLLNELQLVTLKVKPLRERKEDIASLITYFIDKVKDMNPRIAKHQIEILDYLKKQELECNVLEMMRIIENYAIE